MIAPADRIVVQRRESLCSRVNGGVPAVGADARGRVLPAEHVVHADNLSGRLIIVARSPAGSKVAPR